MVKIIHHASSMVSMKITCSMHHKDTIVGVVHVSPRNKNKLELRESAG